MNLPSELNSDWQHLSKALSEKIPKASLPSKVVDALTELNSEKPFGIACSGGVDSMALLLLLWAHFPKLRSRMHVLHYNHGTRGATSDAEADFVARVAKQLQLPFHFQKNESQCVSNSEESLRQLRLDYFHRVLKSLKGNVICFGHQQEDIAESMIMRMARGSGLAGLSAPRPVHTFNKGWVHLRPLLTISKEVLIKAFKKLQIPWCEDATNATNVYTRNRIRHTIIPEFSQLPPGNALRNVARTRRLLEEDDTALQSWLESLVTTPVVGDPLDTTVLEGKPKALYRRLLHAWLNLNDLASHLESKSFEKLLNGIIKRDSLKISAGFGVFICSEEGILKIETKRHQEFLFYNPTALIINGSVQLPNIGSVSADWVAIDSGMYDRIRRNHYSNESTVFLIIDPAQMPLFVRPWKPGDRYRPLGALGNRKLQDFFTDKKIPVFERRKRPVIMNKEGRLIWCPGLPPADSSKLLTSTTQALRLTYSRT